MTRQLMFILKLLRVFLAQCQREILKPSLMYNEFYLIELAVMINLHNK